MRAVSDPLHDSSVPVSVEKLAISTVQMKQLIRYNIAFSESNADPT